MKPGAVNIVSVIPFELDTQALMQRVRLAPDSDEAREFEGVVEQVRKVARPKALYREVFIAEKGHDTVRLGDVVFTSRAVRINLATAERVFAFVATCGGEVDAVVPIDGDPLREFWVDAIKAELLGFAMSHLGDQVVKRHRLGKTAVMHPGSGDATVWPIEQQRQLFALLGNVEAAIGVRLTDSCLMVPNKTVSGIRFPTEKDFRACQVCHREECPNRSAPFDKALWDSLQHD